MADLPDTQRLLNGCDDAQIAAITSEAKPLLVLAGAGSGKTRVLTRRIAWRVITGDALARHVLALTFTRKAAGELRLRLRDIGLPPPLNAGTFHAIALSQLRQRALDQGRAVPNVLASKASVLGPVLSTFGGHRRGSERELISAVAGEIEWAKTSLVTPERYEIEAAQAERSPEVDATLIAGAFAAYELEKRRRRVFDFEDLLVRAAEEIEGDADFAATQRWRFRHLFIDEFQDANAAQLRLLDAWRGGRDDLFAVGDPNQSIYGWNGADRSAIVCFSERYPGASVLELGANYRSTPQIVAIASSILDPSANRALATRSDGPVPVISSYSSDAEEAKAVAAAVRSAHRRGWAFSSCAVLARTNAQLTLFEQALEEARVPWRSASSSTLFLQPGVRRVLSTLERRSGAAAFCAWLDDLELDATSTATSDPERPTTEGEEATAEGAVTDRADLVALVELGRDYLLYDPVPNGDGFLAFAREALRRDPAPTHHDGVELSTFHRAKGLEWPVVFVVGLERGYVPIARAKSEDALQEEERLLYVALSRAIAELSCSFTRERSFGQRVIAREPSPYLERIDIVRRGLGGTQIATGDTALRAIAESRAALEGTRQPR